MKKVLRIATWPARFGKAFWQLLLNNGAFAGLMLGLTVLGVLSAVCAIRFAMITASKQALNLSLSFAGSIGAGFCGTISLLCLALCLCVLAEKIDWKSLK
jgi:hypothetical protein